MSTCSVTSRGQHTSSQLACARTSAHMNLPVVLLALDTVKHSNRSRVPLLERGNLQQPMSWLFTANAKPAVPCMRCRPAERLMCQFETVFSATAGPFMHIHIPPWTWSNRRVTY